MTARHSAGEGRPPYRVVFGTRDSSGEETFADALMETDSLEEALDWLSGAKFDLAPYYTCGRELKGDDSMARVSFFARLDKGDEVFDEDVYGRREYLRDSGLGRAKAVAPTIYPQRTKGRP